MHSGLLNYNGWSDAKLFWLKQKRMNAGKYGSSALYALYYDDYTQSEGKSPGTFSQFCYAANVLLEAHAVTKDACRWGLAFSVFEELQRRRAEHSLTPNEERAHILALKAFMREWDKKIDGL